MICGFDAGHFDKLSDRCVTRYAGQAAQQRDKNSFFWSTSDIFC